MIGIVCAVPDELNCVLALFKETIKISLKVWEIYIGILGDAKAVVIMSGMGKVNAALAVKLLSEEFPVSMIIAYGTAGAINQRLNIGDLVIGLEHCYYDCFRSKSVSNEGLPHMMSRTFKADAELIKKASNALKEQLPKLPENIANKTSTYYPNLIEGKIISGDDLCQTKARADDLYQSYNADCVDMESTAIAHTCTILGIPFINIRIISDYANEHMAIYYLRYSKYLHLYLTQTLSLIITEIYNSP